MAQTEMQQDEIFYSDSSDAENDNLEIVFQEDSSSSDENSSSYENSRRRRRRRNRRNRRQGRRRTVRFMTSTQTQTEPFMMIGKTVCVTGPAVDQRIRYRQETDGLQTLIDRLREKLERRQRRIEKLEKEIVEKEVETVACRMKSLAFRTQAEMGEEIIEEFAAKIQMVTEELARERIERDREDVTIDEWEVE